jgi:uncharacterized protein
VAKSNVRHAITGFCLVGALIAFEASQALAQPRPAPAAPTAPAQPAAPAQPPAAPLPPLAASHLALARSVMDASGISTNFDSIVPNIALQLLQAYVNKRPGNAKDFEEILLSMKPELDVKKKEFLAKATEIYARKIDEASLKSVLAFLQTPVGMKYTAALPDILNEVADASEAWTKEIATAMGARVVDEMMKRGVDLGR